MTKSLIFHLHESLVAASLAEGVDAKPSRMPRLATFKAISSAELKDGAEATALAGYVYDIFACFPCSTGQTPNIDAPVGHVADGSYVPFVDPFVEKGRS